MSLYKENRSSRRASGSLLSVDQTPQSQSEDFFTDSLLDASKIPTPSPKKQPFHKAYKERRAIGNSRALKAAWQSGARGSFSDNDGTNPSAHFLRPTKLPSPSRSPSPLRKIDGTSTPPPDNSPTSPSIVSSPAHGLDETYKRIAEEEDIAAQEGQLGDDEEYTDEMYDNEGYGGAQDAQPDETDAQSFESDMVYNLSRNKENVPLEDGTAATNISGLSFLEGLTDQGLAAKLTPHAVQAAKDRALLEKASQRQTPINFKGAKNGPTLTERLQGRSSLEADEISQRVEQDRRRDDADSFHEPPPNVPKSWTKQKPGKDWMSRSRQRREQGRNGIMSSPGPDSSQVDWAAAADIPLPSVEDETTPKTTASKTSSPASLRSQPSLDRVRQWELNDFTGQSLQVSDSPPVRPRTNLTDQIQQREIERLEKQAVTTSRLGQYRRRDPNELIRVLNRGKSPNVESAPDTYPTPEPSATPPTSKIKFPSAASGTPSASAQASKAVKFAQDGDHIPNTPVVVYRSSSSSSNSTLKQDTRPNHDRKASEDRLARLARAMSNSPKPSSTPEDQSLLVSTKLSPHVHTPGIEGKEVVAHDTLIERVVKENQAAVERFESSRKSSKQLADEDTTPKAKKIAETAKTPNVIGAWTDTILPETVLRTIRKQGERPQNAQTPHISAGGWIETPGPDGKRHSSAQAPIPIEEEEPAPVPEGLTNGISKTRETTVLEKSSKEPASVEAPRSALTTLLARAKSRLTATEGPIPESNDTLHLNDSTINSLEDLLTLDNAELTTLIRMGAESEAREQLIRDHLGAEPIAEAELLERLSGKLNALRTNIHDARKGISKLEHQVSASPEARSSNTLALKANGSCRTCGSESSGYVVSLYLPFSIPHLLHTCKPSQLVPRPTWLGWLTIIAWVWYFSEQAMAHRFGHPLHTDRVYAWPSEPEPSFPLVLPTMLWRWSGRKVVPTLLGPAWWLFVAIFRAVGQALGWTDGFIDDGAMTGHGPGVGQVLGGLEDAAGMDGDAFL